MFLVEHNDYCRLELSRAKHDRPKQEEKELEEDRPSTAVCRALSVTRSYGTDSHDSSQRNYEN